MADALSEPEVVLPTTYEFVVGQGRLPEDFVRIYLTRSDAFDVIRSLAFQLSHEIETEMMLRLFGQLKQVDDDAPD